jgi:phosphatidylglycerol:prolipoprotein diacylglycerol transferase
VVSPPAKRPPPEDADPQALVVSHWFDPGEDGEPYTATVRLTGRRVGATGRLGARDSFTREETIADVVPGTGPVSLTTWVYGIAKAEWDVSAELVTPPVPAERRRFDSPRRSGPTLSRAAWSWRRWALADGAEKPVSTRWTPLAPLARSPAVLPGAFTALAVLGILVAVVSQAAILAQRGMAVERGLVITALALIAGLLGAKLWYMALKARPWRETIGQGWSVDGFLVAAPITAILATLALGVPTGAYLDATAPGIFLAVAIGRVGCFLTGCCAGRCTTSRWGIWSSDRRVGARRIPAQLLESGVGLVLAVVSLLAVLGPFAGADGAVFVVTLASYGIARQLLLRLRAEARPFSWRRSQLAPQNGR